MRGIPRSRRFRLVLATLLGAIVSLYASQSAGRQLYSSDSTYLDLGATFKNLFLGNRYYEIPFVEDRTKVTDYMRGRLMLDMGTSEILALEIHSRLTTVVKRGCRLLLYAIREQRCKNVSTTPSEV